MNKRNMINNKKKINKIDKMDHKNNMNKIDKANKDKQGKKINKISKINKINKTGNSFKDSSHFTKPILNIAQQVLCCGMLRRLGNCRKLLLWWI